MTSGIPVVPSPRHSSQLLPKDSLLADPVDPAKRLFLGLTFGCSTPSVAALLVDDLEAAAECECPIHRTLPDSTLVVHVLVVVAVRRVSCSPKG